jgi:hypothetical protein
MTEFKHDQMEDAQGKVWGGNTQSFHDLFWTQHPTSTSMFTNPEFTFQSFSRA